MSVTQFIKVDSHDNVAIALFDLEKGSVLTVNGTSVILEEDIPAKHKFSLENISAGNPVIKYGYPIGKASLDIIPGKWIHSHNLSTGLAGTLEYSYNPRQSPPKIPSGLFDTFMGYLRPNQDVGVRNEIWIIPTVACSNATAISLAQKANESLSHLCDGVCALPHSAGCSQLGDDLITSQRILAGITLHPNAGGVLLLSLGCENNHLSEFLPYLGDYDKKRIRTLVMQDEGDEYAKGLEILAEIAQEISRDQRQPIPASKLRLGFKCGGSDAFSGITANPLCGRIADIVTSLGGIGILTEVPEMFGAEEILMSRADVADTFKHIVGLINGFKQYFLDYDQPVSENPSPGNKKGGITTLEEKSLGCITKGGHATVTATIDMGQRAVTPGLNLLNGPGNDNVSITNLLSSGAQIILFTTGSGNPLGTAAPTMKISSNTSLASRKPSWIDFNAGRLLEGFGMDDLASELWGQVLDTASGKIKAKNEIGGQRDIMIFKNGVTL